jgi:hypothetical protein
VRKSIVFRELSALKTWERNYRLGDIDALIASFVRFGFNGALKVWRDTVMAGNHALLALRTMQASGASAPVGIETKGKAWSAPTIDLSHLSEREAEAFAIADNRTQERGSYDPRRLAELLEEIRSDESLEGSIGYEQGDLDRLLAEVAALGEFAPEPTPEGQGKLDGRSPIECPKCGHSFTP